MFQSFFMGGFECSTHRRRDGRRLDIIAATRHDRMCEGDYRLLQTQGIRTVRDGLRWHLIETAPGRYDWSSLRPMLQAARRTRTQVIWDLFHYGWPDGLDIFSREFVDRFTAYALAAVREMRAETAGTIHVVPINEISFMAWAGGDHAAFNPYAIQRGEELKIQLARAAISAMKAMRAAEPDIRFVHAEPAIRVIPRPDDPASAERAVRHNDAQFHALDMIAGTLRPELGGRPDLIDVLGVNYYCHNQWHEGGGPIPWQGEDPDYLPFSHLLAAIYRRYRKPLLITETGIEAKLRPLWLRHVAGEVALARRRGIPVEGICLYPVMNHPGWDDERHCPNGLIDYSPPSFERVIDQPLAEELARQRRRFADAAEGPGGALRMAS